MLVLLSHSGGDLGVPVYLANLRSSAKVNIAP